MGEFLGKTDKPRPFSTTREERDLRDALMYKLITFEQYEKKYNKLLDEGKIKRNGIVVRRIVK